MRKAKFVIEEKQYEGLLTFEVLADLRDEIEDSIFEDVIGLICKGDMDIVSRTVYLSLYDKEGYSQLLKLDARMRGLILDKYIGDLLNLSLLKKDEFEEEDEWEDNPWEDQKEIRKKKDWDLSYMQYMWETVMGRDDFYSQTPRTYAEQLDMYKKFNKIEDEEIEEL